eukprot:2152957-Pleurochrysis_carterae.AAC.1
MCAARKMTSLWNERCEQRKQSRSNDTYERQPALWNWVDHQETHYNDHHLVDEAFHEEIRQC